MNFRIRLLTTVSVLALVGASGTAFAADPYAMSVLSDPSRMPAVSATNGKLGAFAGSLAGASAYGVNGSLALPLHDQYGAQVDGLLGTAHGGLFYGVGGHLFWRDPAVGLLGAYASYVSWDLATTSAGTTVETVFDIAGGSVGKVGVEGEAYLGQVSLEGLAGYQFGTNTGLTGTATVALYPTDDLRLDLGVRYLQGPGASIFAGAEWQPSGTHMSLFADASVGADSQWSALGGVKVYFGGEQKSLIRRHREDDPDSLLPGDLYSVMGDERCIEPGGNIDDGCF